AILLDRIADVYPDMYWNPLAKAGFKHSDGSSKRGRVEGRIWETGLATIMAQVYDFIYDGIQGDAELARFCAAMATTHKLTPRQSIADVCRHIEDHLLLEILKGTREGDIYGNTGMHQMTVVTAAIALDRPVLTAQWLDWLFDPRYPGDFTKKHDSIPWILTEGFDRDGMGGEVGGYGLIWVRGLVRVAELLARYPDYTAHDMLREFPKLKQCFLVQARLNCLDAAMPMTGDSGSTGRWIRAGSADIFLRGYTLYRDERLAGLAHHYAEGNMQRLRTSESIFDPAPEELAATVAAIGAKHTFRLRSTHMGRYGQGVLQTGGDDPAHGRAIWMHYGHHLGHSHRDNLNLGLYACNISMLPDLGYPEYCEGRPKQRAWTANTISHNTLLVGDAMQEYSPGGKIKLFADIAPLRVLDVTSPGAYRVCTVYRRTVALIDVSPDNSYVLDIFRARGGTNHRLLYQGPAQTAHMEGIEMLPQPTGTFAGPDIEPDRVNTNGKRDPFLYNSGFSYLWDVERSSGAVSVPYTVDWKGEDRRGRIKKGSEPHLRLHALTACDEVALASGQPPPNKAGNPKSLRKLIQSRLGDNMRSQFATVLEPYETTPFIRRVRRLGVEHAADKNDVVAIEVELIDGTSDVLISCREPTAVHVESDIAFVGVFGMVRRVGGRVVCMRMSMGTRLECGSYRLTTPKAAYRGTVVAVNADDPANNTVQLNPPLPRESALVGQTILFENNLSLDTSYEIKRVTEAGISTGDMTLVRRFKDRTDYKAGHEFLVNPGDAYVVPVHVSMDAR
ncbi:MAG: heparinase II/III family protein, partial [Lentisphaeria bacterium]|nr:heparinase II/III family protein [Lentisphaeria bacterium]